MEEKTEELLAAMDMLFVCSRMIKEGRWTAGDIRWSLDQDEYYDLILTAIHSCCEYVFSSYDEESCDASMYFSDPCMLEYYKLCREYSRRRGMKLKDNPYVRKAASYVNRMLSGPYTCGHIIHTKVNHKCAGGIHFIYSVEFDSEMELLDRMLDIVRFYKDGVNELNAELAKSTALAVIYTPTLGKAAA